MAAHGGLILGGAPHGGWLLGGSMFWACVFATLLFWSACLVLHSGGTLYSIKLYFRSASYLVFSKDSKWKKGYPRPLPAAGDKDTIVRRRIIFIRHGESTWNETFNPKGAAKLLLPYLLAKALITEAYLLLAGQRDSWFFDSMLNKEGQHQAAELRDHLRDGNPQSIAEAHGVSPLDAKEDFDLLRGASSTQAVLASSILRRAISTVAIALCDQLHGAKKIVWLPSCQEISRNPDTLCISPPAGGDVAPKIGFFDRSAGANVGVDLAATWASAMDTARHTGDKTTTKQNGGDRLHTFAHWATAEDTAACVILGGHSIWFRSFFREFLPAASDGEPAPCSTARIKKLHNGGAVSFELCALTPAGGGDQVFYITPGSLRTVFKGFQK